MWESIPCVAGLSVQGMLRAGLSVSLYPERVSVCLFLWVSLELWDEGWVKNQSFCPEGVAWGLACSSGAQLPALSVPGELPLQLWAAAVGAAFLGECQEDPQDEIATWPVLPPCLRHGRGQALLAVQPKWGAQRTPTATLLFSVWSNSDIPFFVWTWNILITVSQGVELLFPVPWCFPPSRWPGWFGNYRKSTRLLPLIKDNGCECVSHWTEGAASAVSHCVTLTKASLPRIPYLSSGIFIYPKYFMGQAHRINIGFHRGVLLERNCCLSERWCSPSGVILSPVTAVKWRCGLP